MIPSPRRGGCGPGPRRTTEAKGMSDGVQVVAPRWSLRRRLRWSSPRRVIGGVVAAPSREARLPPSARGHRNRWPGAEAPSAELTEGSRTSQARGSVNVRRLAAKKPSEAADRHAAASRHVRRIGRTDERWDGERQRPEGRGRGRAIAPPTPRRTRTTRRRRPGSRGSPRHRASPTSGEPPDPGVAVGPRARRPGGQPGAAHDRPERHGTISTVSLPDFFNLPTDPVSV